MMKIMNGCPCSNVAVEQKQHMIMVHKKCVVLFYLRWNRLIIASSRSNGMLVAARTITFSTGFDNSPSQWDMNSFLILLIVLSSLLDRFPSKLSTSSMKMIVGETFAASENKARMFFSPTPNQHEEIVDEETLMKLAPASFAIAFASIVFPVPGGPKSNTPLHGFRTPSPLNISGLLRGSITAS